MKIYTVESITTHDVYLTIEADNISWWTSVFCPTMPGLFPHPEIVGVCIGPDMLIRVREKEGDNARQSS